MSNASRPPAPNNIREYLQREAEQAKRSLNLSERVRQAPVPAVLAALVAGTVGGLTLPGRGTASRRNGRADPHNGNHNPAGLSTLINSWFAMNGLNAIQQIVKIVTEAWKPQSLGAATGAIGRQHHSQSGGNGRAGRTRQNCDGVSRLRNPWHDPSC